MNNQLQLKVWVDKDVECWVEQSLGAGLSKSEMSLTSRKDTMSTKAISLNNEGAAVQ